MSSKQSHLRPAENPKEGYTMIYVVNTITQKVVEQGNDMITAAGIDTESFGLICVLDEDGRAHAIWQYSKELQNGEIFIDLLDDLGGDSEVELDYATQDFGIELSATQKSIFNEIEPKLGILRRIWYVTDQLEKIADTI
jgi:hypothetical protein